VNTPLESGERGFFVLNFKRNQNVGKQPHFALKRKIGLRRVAGEFLVDAPIGAGG